MTQTPQQLLTDVTARLIAVAVSYSTIIIDYTHSVNAAPETVADDVLTSGQLYGMPWILNARLQDHFAHTLTTVSTQLDQFMRQLTCNEQITAGCY